jgi:Uma2 family endonuclease
MTLDEYLALPEEKPYLEYIHGRVVQKAAKTKARGPAGPGGSAPPDFREVVRRPSAHRIANVVRYPRRRGLLPARRLVLRAGERPGQHDRALPPTLAVEIRSPDDALGALRDKFRLMRAHGVDACWHIDPEQRTAEVFDGMADGSLLAAGGQLTSPFLPGFALPLAELWAAID